MDWIQLDTPWISHSQIESMLSKKEMAANLLFLFMRTIVAAKPVSQFLTNRNISTAGAVLRLFLQCRHSHIRHLRDKANRSQLLCWRINLKHMIPSSAFLSPVNMAEFVMERASHDFLELKPPLSILFILQVGYWKTWALRKFQWRTNYRKQWLIKCFLGSAHPILCDLPKAWPADQMMAWTYAGICWGFQGRLLCRFFPSMRM